MTQRLKHIVYREQYRKSHVLTIRGSLNLYSNWLIKIEQDVQFIRTKHLVFWLIGLTTAINGFEYNRRWPNFTVHCAYFQPAKGYCPPCFTSHTVSKKKVPRGISPWRTDSKASSGNWDDLLLMGIKEFYACIPKSESIKDR